MHQIAYIFANTLAASSTISCKHGWSSVLAFSHGHPQALTPARHPRCFHPLPSSHKRILWQWKQRPQRHEHMRYCQLQCRSHRL